eukprot:6148792-Alexandrium_andersonii.AAC.1
MRGCGVKHQQRSHCQSSLTVPLVEAHANRSHVAAGGKFQPEPPACRPALALVLKDFVRNP